MIRVHPELPRSIAQVKVQGICPNCEKGTTYTLATLPYTNVISDKGIKSIVVSYSCDLCLAPIPIQWTVTQADNNNVIVAEPNELITKREPFIFDHVPSTVEKEIKEALDCLSVGACNGFAALCRRAIQAICSNLGAGTTTKIKNQIEDMMKISGFNQELYDSMIQIMLSGHDGSHPHLPDVNLDRAAVLLELLKDLTYQLYTRPGRIKEAAQLRQAAIAQKQE